MDSRLPGVTVDGRQQVVCHVDADCFYAACERLREPALRGEPLVVGMGYEDGETHGAVATASYEARAYGVESAMAISEALDLLPRAAGTGDATDEATGTAADSETTDAGHYRPVDMDYYESVAAEVKAILHDTADTVREVSVDEAYLDVTDTVGWDDPESFAATLKDRIRAEVGIPVSVGVAPTMSAAKIASDHDKPDGLVVVEPGDVRGFLAPLDVSEVHNVGPVTARELREMDIETAGDLAAADPETLESRFGERGREIWNYARGEDDRSVEPKGQPKSLSRESAFTEATDDHERKRDRVRALAADVAERAEREGAIYRTIGVKVVTPPFDVNTRADSLPGPVSDPALVREVTLDLLEEFREAEVRKLGVRVSNLSFPAGEQTDLDGWGRDEPRENRSLGEFADGGQERTTDERSGQTALTDFE
ncbi:DNA polymerase Y family protein [Halorientalis litorea]|uniref:DNA polymerase Y family protein n=1 Tax=Halorientalis litorea TaxID=2931977 RepID=UPI001FF45AFA|nr:DNA polymerase IV [Halorientalis litorea]